MQPINELQKELVWYKELDESVILNEAITKKEYYQLLAIYPYGCMERIIWRFAWETGARPLEIIGLSKTNFSEDLRQVQFGVVKGKYLTKVRHCYLSLGFARELEYYLSILLSPNGFLFPSRYHKRMIIGSSFLNNELDRRRVQLASITGNERWTQKNRNNTSIIHPYSFRYARIRNLLMQNYNIGEIAIYFQHSKVNTTLKYARFMNNSKFEKAARIEPDVTTTFIDEKQHSLIGFIPKKEDSETLTID